MTQNSRLLRAAAVVAVAALIPSTAVGATVAHAAKKPAPHAKKTSVPFGFVGVNADGPVFDGGLNQPSLFGQMEKAGVQSVRMMFSWGQAQPYPNMRSVPPSRRKYYVNVGGVPTNWAYIDQAVLDASQYGIKILPVVINSPYWDARRTTTLIADPKRVGPYANFLTALIQRYGPHGSLWPHVPAADRDPIRQWQIWNEPNYAYFWNQSVAAYVNLVRAANTAIKRADPGAHTVLAALTNYSWEYLAQIYKVRGARKVFDVVAANPFTAQPPGVVTILGYVRHVMNANGDRRKPLIATEVGWTSALGVCSLCKYHTGYPNDWDTTESQQAQRVGAVIPLLVAHRKSLGLATFYDYTWMGVETQNNGDSFGWAGLYGYKSPKNVYPKPVLFTFVKAALKAEGCSSKGARATVCLH